MSKVGQYYALTLPITTITGNAGGPVGPDGVGNFNLVGVDPITVTGNPVTHTETITVATATTLQIGVTTLATDAETIGGVVTDNAVVPSGLAAKLGAQTLFGVPYGNTTAGAIQWTGVGTDGQVLIGSTAAAPAFGTLTSVGGTVVFTPGANTLNLEAGGGVAISFTTDDANVVVPLVGNVNVLGAHGINTTGAIANTITTAINNTITLGDLVNVTGANAITLTTGDATITAGNINLTNTTIAGTIGIINYGGTRFIHNYGANNTFVGNEAGTLALTVANANFSSGFGYKALNALTTGQWNTACGAQALVACTTSGSNCAMGLNSLPLLTTGTGGNVAIGARAGELLATGYSNIMIGSSAGGFYTGGEHHNIIIGNSDVVADVGTIRIGIVGQSTTCYISGIAGVNVGNVASVVSINGNQLGTTTITAGAGITVTPGAGTITLAAPGTGMIWTREAGAAVAIADNHGYINTNGGLTTFTLPILSAVGDEFAIMGESAAGWTIAQNAGQNIQIGAVSTTGGVGGSLASSNRYDGVHLICRVANTTFQNVEAPQGNLTIV